MDNDTTIRKVMIDEISRMLGEFQKEHKEIRISYLIGILDDAKILKNNHEISVPLCVVELIDDLVKRIKFYNKEHNISMIEIKGILTILQYNYIIIIDGISKIKDSTPEQEPKEKENGK